MVLIADKRAINIIKALHDILVVVLFLDLFCNDLLIELFKEYHIPFFLVLYFLLLGLNLRIYLILAFFLMVEACEIHVVSLRRCSFLLIWRILYDNIQLVRERLLRLKLGSLSHCHLSLLILICPSSRAM